LSIFKGDEGVTWREF
jgi:hypothetical protein